MTTTLKCILGAAAVSVFAFAAQAATVTPTISAGGSAWSFGDLAGDNVSDTSFDVATDLPLFIDFFAEPVAGSLTITVTNSGDTAKSMAAGNLLCLGLCTSGSYTLSFDGSEVITVTSGAAAEMGMFSVAAGGSGDLVWSWDLPTTRGQVSTNISPVPVPAAGFLLLGGLGGLAMLRRKKQA